MTFRRSIVTAAAALAAAGCSASAGVSSSPTEMSTEEGVADPTSVSSDGDTTAATGSPDTTGDASTSTTNDATTTTDEATTTTDGATTTTDEATTTTIDTVVPTPLPERDIPPVAARTVPLQPVGTSNGEATIHAQWRLLELGFWLESPDGRYDNTTQQAVMAFQKYYGLEPDGSLGPMTAEALTKVSERPQGRSTTGTLVEVDKSKQLVFLVEQGVVKWILNTSTGTEIPYDEINKNTGLPERGDSVTRTGVFNVDREREEGWWDGDLGSIYRPKYFSGGIALHGSNYIPAYPASHGCVRLSTDAMDWIWETGAVPMGTTVWVHGEIPA